MRSSALARAVLESKIPGVYLRNASDLPVSSLSVALVEGATILGVQFVGVLPPDAGARFQPLGADLEEALSNVMVPMGTVVNGGKGQGPTVAITFVDGAGQGWVRGPRGDLEPVHPEIIHDQSHGELWSLVGLR